MANIPSDFSFDLYPGLDADLEAAYERNVEAGIVTAEDMATGGLAAAVQNSLKTNPNLSGAKEARSWFNDSIGHASEAWQKYPMLVPVPTTEGMFADEVHRNFYPTIERLHDAHERLTASGELTPEGYVLGDTMELVLVPWQAFRDNLSNIETWLTTLRTKQDVQNADYINPDLLNAIKNNETLYRHSDNPEQQLSAREYLNMKIEQDGYWGMMLTQTSNDAGIKRLVEGSPDDRAPDSLTSAGKDNFMLHGENVGQMGIFEWLALTLQEDPTKLSSKDYSWLLANRLDVNGDPCVPCGSWRGGRVGSHVSGADYARGRMRPRLAVM